jgi:hypothetical protein
MTVEFVIGDCIHTLKGLPSKPSSSPLAPVKPPYPWFGGKSRIAPEVWRRFGAVRNYVEPFLGGGAILLLRPPESWPEDVIGVETANDINAWRCNFWGAVKADPDAVARHAADPVSELDLHARGDALFYRGVRIGEKRGVRVLLPDEFCERLRADEDYCDAKIAGWWVWGQCSWIGDAWGRTSCRSRPHLGGGKGVNRQLPHLRNPGKGVTETSRLAAITAYMRQLCDRAAMVRVCCGDWRRVLGPCVTTRFGLTGVFLDPPYAVADRDTVYGEDESRTLAHDVRAWCIEHGGDPLLRIALCGYEEHDDLAGRGWTPFRWRAHGGYSSLRRGDTPNPNRLRETVWFSPACEAKVTARDMDDAPLLSMEPT